MKPLFAFIAVVCCLGPCVQAAPPENHAVQGLPLDGSQYIGTAAFNTPPLTDLKQVSLGGGMGEKPCTFVLVNQTPSATGVSDQASITDMPDWRVQVGGFGASMSGWLVESCRPCGIPAKSAAFTVPETAAPPA